MSTCLASLIIKLQLLSYVKSDVCWCGNLSWQGLIISNDHGPFRLTFEKWTRYWGWHVVNQQQWSHWRWYRWHCASRIGRAIIFVIIIRGTAHEETVLASRNRAIISTFAPCEIAGRFLPSLSMNHACGIMFVIYMKEMKTLLQYCLNIIIAA